MEKLQTFCIFCGRQLKDGAVFCSACGKAVQDSKVQQPAMPKSSEVSPARDVEKELSDKVTASTKLPVTQAASLNSSDSFIPSSDQSPRKKNGGLILALVLSCLLLLGGGTFAVYHFLINKDKEPKAGVQESTTETEDSVAKASTAASWDAESEAVASQEATESTPATQTGENIADLINIFETNYKALVSAFAMYQAGNNGAYPTSASDLDPYLNGGVAALIDNPPGVSYSVGADGRITASYIDGSGDVHTFTYPTVAGNSTVSTTPEQTSEGHSETETETEASTEAPTTQAPTEQETEAAARITLKREEIRIGTEMTFGRYEQDNNSANGPEDIEWIVYYKNQKDVYFISKYILDVVPFENGSVSSGYSSSALLRWMEGSFLEEAFSWEEREYLMIQELDKPSNANYSNVPQGQAVKSKVGIFTLKEMQEYLGSNLGSQIYKAEGTPYALAQGLLKSSQGYSPWWTRSMGKGNTDAAYVQTNGEFSYEGAAVNSQNIGIRPVICFSLDTFGPGDEILSAESYQGNGWCTGDTWLREAAGITQKTIMIIPKGATLYFTGKSQLITNADGTLHWWYEVIYNGISGWASGANVVHD